MRGAVLKEACLCDFNHTDNLPKSLDQEYTNEAKQLSLEQVSYGSGVDLCPVQCLTAGIMHLSILIQNSTLTFSFL